MNNEPILKKKKFNFKAQYVYNGVLLLFLTLGITYALVFFIHNEAGTTANLKSSLVTLDVSELNTISLSHTSPVTDSEGLNGISEVITITNTSSIDTFLKISFNLDSSNTISTENIRYGLYINGTLEKVDTLGTDNIVYDGLLLAKETTIYEIYLWIDYHYNGGGNSFGGTFNVETLETVMTLADYTSKLVGKDKGIYAINSSGSVSLDGTDIREYRYSGTDANNYVWFNCKDGYTSGSENCELWRMIGNFDVKTNEYTNSYQRVKIVKEEVLSNKTFGNNNIFSESSIDTYLNGDYYNTLTDSAKKMIVDGEWNTGSSLLTNTPNASLISEMTSKVYKKVGLLSASDIGYATSTNNYTKSLNDTTLYLNSWLTGNSYYTLTSITDSTTDVIGDNGTIITSLGVNNETGIKPVVYLMPNVYVKSGNGSSNKPYELSYVDEVMHYDNVRVVGYITYDTNGGDVDVPKKQAIFADGSTVVAPSFADSSLGTFEGWATSRDGEVVYQQGDKINENESVTLYAKWLSKKLVERVINTMPLTETDANGTRFVYGKDVNNNYVWYSGKLWRILSLDDNDNIKMVTQGAMTSIAFDKTTTNTDYSTSQMRTWLKNEFFPTIENKDTLLVESTWDYTPYSSFPDKLLDATKTITNEKVGLLNIYEYMKTGGSSDETKNNSFLNVGYYWWLMNEQASGTHSWSVTSSNNALQAELTNGYGIRPAVILNSNVWILSGNGQKGNPYIIDGDKSFGQKSELLSNRLSGEYILFNNVKYRIVGVENGLTKVTMADYDLNKNSINTSLAFGADVSQIRFSPTYGIGLYLENWYKATSENDTNKIYSNIYINSTYKDMIATSDADEVVWYVGPDTGGTQYDYEKSKTGTPVSATIGMGRYGELFSSQFGEGGNTSITYTWLITKHISSLLWRLNNNGGVYSFAPTKELAVRPSFYLKADVKLGDVDGDGDIGTGMPHDPYEIVQ